jgi:hypothetical protein
MSALRILIGTTAPPVVVAALAVPAPAQTLADQVGGCLGNPPERTINAGPSNYRSLLPTLGPGDRLLLAGGTYAMGLPIDSLNGQPGRCIVVEGPETGPRAVFTGRSCCNTVSIRDSSHVAIRNLELDGLGLAVDAVKAEGDASFAHHITLENLDIRGHGADQQIVGINTKCPAWNWVVRRNVIVGAGTGLYFGDSDGSAEFVAGLVEHNLVRDTIGYNMQVKHQNSRNTALGIPATAQTVIRHNVFSKAQGASMGADARPNLLVGHWPLSGPGANDVYLIYGNFFHQNPSEALFQGAGHVALYANLFLNDFGDAVNFQFHEGGSVRNAEVFHNTVVASGSGIRVTGTEAGYTQRVRASAVFSPLPISAAGQSDNVTAGYGVAGSYLTDPTAPVGAGLSLFPLPGTLSGAAADLSGLAGLLDYDRDFNGSAFDPVFRGAYSGEGTNPGWALALDRKPEPSSAPASPADFYTLAPCRVADTRLPPNPLPPGPDGGPALVAGQSRPFDLAGRCGIPSSARAVSVNLTVTQATAPGNLRLHPAGTAVPTVSSLNYAAGQTRGNNAIVPLSSAAALAIHCGQASGTAHAIMDVNGYFE